MKTVYADFGIGRISSTKQLQRPAAALFSKILPPSHANAANLKGLTSFTDTNLII